MTTPTTRPTLAFIFLRYACFAIVYSSCRLALPNPRTGDISPITHRFAFPTPRILPVSSDYYLMTATF